MNDKANDFPLQSQPLTGAILNTFFLAIFLCYTSIFSAPAPEIPGKEIDEGALLESESTRLTEPYENPSPTKHQQLWTAPSVSDQLSSDPILIPMGMGALFVPTFTDPRLEPSILIFRNKSLYIAGTTGARLILEPGPYRIVVGSGERSLRQSFEVIIREGHTTVLQPEWAGLTIETLNSDGEYYEEEYEIYRIDKPQIYGKGYGATVERLGEIKTWFLPSGIYRIAKSGTDLSSYTNYVTVQLTEGQLNHVELIFQKDTPFDLIAGGIKSWRQDALKTGNWRFNLRFGGNLNYTDQTVDGKSTKSTLAIQGDLQARALYQNVKYTGNSELRIRESVTREKGTYTPLIDQAQLRSTWVRLFKPWIGPYLRAKVSTDLIPDEQIIDGGYITNIQGDTTRTLDSGDLQVSPAIYPIELGEGAGVSLNLSTNDVFDLSIQAGAAARQEIVKDQLVIVPDKSNLWTEGENSREFGVESNATLRLRFGSRLTLDVLADVFLENGKWREYRIEDLSAELRFSVTRNLELSYNFDLDDRVARLGRDNPERFAINQGIFLRVAINW